MKGALIALAAVAVAVALAALAGDAVLWAKYRADHRALEKVEKLSISTADLTLLTSNQVAAQHRTLGLAIDGQKTLLSVTKTLAERRLGRRLYAAAPAEKATRSARTPRGTPSGYAGSKRLYLLTR